MSVVTIQLGQCGNQTGTDLFDTLINDATTPQLYSNSSSSLNNDYREGVIERFFSQSNVPDETINARAVMIDTEPKVINQCYLKAEKSGKWSFAFDNQYCKMQGSGNNWAQGYQRYGKDVAQEILNLTRKEVEKCDMFSGFLVIMSLAGGTGSGLGSFLTRCLHDQFEDGYTVNTVIWPYTSGEVVLQYYNAVLSLAHLYQSSDAIIVMENDHLSQICTKLLGISNVSLYDVNKVAGHKIASVLQPATSSIYQSQSNTIGNIVKDLCCHPSYKLLAVKNVPQMNDESIEYSTFVWSALMKHLRQMLIADSALEEGMDWGIKLPAMPVPKAQSKRGSLNKSIANALFLRGKDCGSVSTTDFQQLGLFSEIAPPQCRLSVWNQERAFNKYEKSATLLSNSQSFVRPLEKVLENAWGMFASRAYLHQYNRYGLTDDDFLDSFGFIEQILTDYKQI